MEWWHVYLFTRLDGLNGMLFVVALVSTITAVFSLWAMAENAQHNKENYTDPDFVRFRYVAKRIGPLAIVFWLAFLAIPTQKEVAAIYLLPKLANSDFAKEAQQIPTDAAKLMRLKLEQWIADMEPKKK